MIRCLSWYLYKIVAQIPLRSCGSNKSTYPKQPSNISTTGLHYLFIKEEIRDLINDSNLSNISIIGRSPAPAAAAKKKSPGRRKKSAAATPSSDRPASQRKGLRSSVSLKSLGNGLKRKLSMEKMNQEEGGAGTTKMKLVKRDPDPMETETNGHQEEGKHFFDTFFWSNGRKF